MNQLIMIIITIKSMEITNLNISFNIILSLIFLIIKFEFKMFYSFK